MAIASLLVVVDDGFNLVEDAGLVLCEVLELVDDVESKEGDW